MVANTRLHIVAQTGQMEINYPHQFKDHGFLVHRVPIQEDGRVVAVVGLVLFDSASTASRLAEKVSFLQSKVHLYENEPDLAAIDPLHHGQHRRGRQGHHLAQVAGDEGRGHYPAGGDCGRVRHRQGALRPGHSQRQPAQGPPVRARELRRDPERAVRVRALRLRPGAFTGAKSTGKPGKIELAHNGSLFLDEIGDLPLEMQPKLLRVLEEKEFERVGGTTLVKSSFRLLAATNHNLERMLAENRFRTDLFYRLNVITLTIPPLRDRREDIVPIAHVLLKQIAADGGLAEVSLSPEAEDFLIGYDWPGNVRELSNVLERAAHYSERERLTVADLPRYLFQRGKPDGPINAETLRHVQQSAERDAIYRALETEGYNKARAARNLGIHRSLFYKKLKKYGVPLRKENA